MLLPNLTFSFIYIALAYPFARFILQKSQYTSIDVLIWFALIFVAPAVFGLLLGWINKELTTQKNWLSWLHRFLQSCGLIILHPIATAWDWKFIDTSEQWVIVTLKDGTYFGGYYDHDSFISSDPSERDIYIHCIYEIDDDGKWCLRPGTGMLISPGEVSRIEFISQPSKEGDQ